MQLTRHFSLEEMTFSETALRYGIDNQPNVIQLSALMNTAVMMEKVRELLGVPIAVTSAFRTQAVNNLIGGSRRSSHCEGRAVDFRPVGMDLFEAAKKIEASDIQYDQLILEYGWIHLGFGSMKRRESLTKRSAMAPYQEGLIDPRGA
jgi:hypothetical protein